MIKKTMSLFLAVTILFTLSSNLSVRAVPKNGFVTKSGKTYYYKNHKKVKGTLWIKHKKYYLKKSIVQKSKFMIIRNKKYRFGKTGVLQKKKWILVKNKYYRANKNGIIIRNKKGVKIGNKKYNFDKNGICMNKKFIKPKPKPSPQPSPSSTQKPNAVKPTDTINIDAPDIRDNINRAMTTNTPFRTDKGTYDNNNIENNFFYYAAYVPPANEVQGESRGVRIGYLNRYLLNSAPYDDKSYHLQVKSGTAYYTTDGTEPSPSNGTKVTKSSGLIKIPPNCQHTSISPYDSYDGIYNVKIHTYNADGKLTALDYFYSTKENCPHIN